MVKSLILTSVLLLATTLNGYSASTEKIPVILDTDIGTDIDDAFALALIIKSPELQLLGVTTVSGDTAARARIAAKMLWEEGGKWRQVPVAAGVPGPKQNIDQAPWAAGFVGPQLLKESAVDFLRGEFHRYPGQITLIAIGELTNVAALIKADPLAAKKIRRLVIMGGSIARGYAPGSAPDAEWNIRSNPAAAQTVFASGIPISMAPLDVTAMLTLDAAGRSRIFNSGTPVGTSLEALYHLFARRAPILFDPMAVAMVIDPGICATRNLAVEVDSKGFTRVANGRPANATVGMKTDPERFFRFYLDRVAGK